MVAIGSGISAASCGKEWKLGVLTSQKSRKQQGDGGGRIEGGRKRRRAEERSAAWRRDDELRSRSGSRGWWWRREYDSPSVFTQGRPGSGSRRSSEQEHGRPQGRREGSDRPLLVLARPPTRDTQKRQRSVRIYLPACIARKRKHRCTSHMVLVCLHVCPSQTPPPPRPHRHYLHYAPPLKACQALSLSFPVGQGQCTKQSPHPGCCFALALEPINLSGRLRLVLGHRHIRNSLQKQQRTHGPPARFPIWTCLPERGTSAQPQSPRIVILHIV
ncbi:hypothetical protein FN846DRAFT_126845 [Sphaerosporella brunnea]|uniref:Uncharacterized protein n=1 Tax=Sphaerosporella brunnea TaxID=1250544 RepID=A0A5J5ES93_9PEZI|nr:hypothetical protein FN846DRAFT_126845 [Sphaerosporella brunnea]